MKIQFRCTILVFLIAILTSCISEYDIKIDSDNDYVTIDAIISTNDTIQYVYIRKPYVASPDIRETNEYDIGTYCYPNIANASVILIDNTTAHKYEYLYYESIDADYYSGTEYIFTEYYLPNFTPEVNHSYTLTVTIGKETYSSTQVIHNNPIVEGLLFRAYNSGGYDYMGNDYIGYRPILFYRDCEFKRNNYYLFIDNEYGFAPIERLGNFLRYVPISPLSDEGMKSEVDGYLLPMGMGAYEKGPGNELNFGSFYHYEIWTVSEENYKFFKSMEAQLTTDGGVYTPCHSSPPTNFSGYHVTGQFIAANVLKLDGMVSDENFEK